MLGGCQGSTGPASIAPDGYEWASRFPYLTIRDQVAAQVRLADALGIDVWAAVARRIDGRDARAGVGRRACPTASSVSASSRLRR